MTQNRNNRRLFKAPRNVENAPDSGDARTMIVRGDQGASVAPDSEPSTLAIARDSEPRTLIARPSTPAGGDHEGPATVMWTRSSVEVRVRAGTVTPAEGLPVATPKRAAVRAEPLDLSPPARPAPDSAPSLPVAGRPVVPSPYPVSSFPMRPKTPPSFRPHAAPARIPTPPQHSANATIVRPAVVAALAQVATPARTFLPPPPEAQRPMAISNAHPVANLARANASGVHASSPTLAHPASAPSYPAHPSQPSHPSPFAQRASTMPPPVSIDPSAMSVTFRAAPPPVVESKGEVGGTLAKLAAVLVFAAIGIFLVRPSVVGAWANGAPDASASDSPTPTPASSWVVPAPTVLVPPTTPVTPVTPVTPPTKVSAPRADLAPVALASASSADAVTASPKPKAKPARSPRRVAPPASPSPSPSPSAAPEAPTTTITQDEAPDAP